MHCLRRAPNKPWLRPADLSMNSEKKTREALRFQRVEMKPVKGSPIGEKSDGKFSSHDFTPP